MTVTDDEPCPVCDCSNCRRLALKLEYEKHPSADLKTKYDAAEEECEEFRVSLSTWRDRALKAESEVKRLEDLLMDVQGELDF